MQRTASGPQHNPPLKCPSTPVGVAMEQSSFCECHGSPVSLSAWIATAFSLAWTATGWHMA
eukprot:3069038-Amphidinium_carterae.2